LQTGLRFLAVAPIPVPEPSFILLLGLGFGAVSLIALRRKR
jgi:hypothetical protein